MKLTNNTGLPNPLVRAIQFDSYKSSGDISVSALISAPQIRILKKLHSHEIEMDVVEGLWMLLGTAVHHILERSHINDIRKRAFLTTIDVLKEKSDLYKGENKEKLLNITKQLFSLIDIFFPEISGRYVYELKLHIEVDGMVLSGQLDLFDKIEGLLEDYKVCSVWAYMYEESRKKWEDQLNCYAYMLSEAGYVVKGINIIGIFKDWSEAKLISSTKNYPKNPFEKIPIQLWDKSRAKKYIADRIALHKKAEQGEIPDCTGSEKWSSATEFAVIPKGMKRAIRVLHSAKEADRFVLENKHKYEKPLSVFIRPGENKFCDKYCVVRDFCSQRKREMEEHNKLIS